MPQYFDPNALSPEQLSRGDAAVAEYNSVMAKNIETRLAKMPESEKQALLRASPKMRGGVKSLDDSVREALSLLTGLTGGGPGNSKSALFARLLDGKPALAEAPPLSFSYPWFALLEEPGPFNVSLGVLPAHAKHPRETAQSENGTLLINQCPWSVVSANDAGRTLLDLQSQLSKTARPLQKGAQCVVHQWSPSLLAEVLKAYADRPEFIVQNGNWPTYRLYLSRQDGTAGPGYVERSLSPASLVRHATVFDPRTLRINLAVGKPFKSTKAAPGEPPRVRFVEIEYDDWFLIAE